MKINVMMISNQGMKRSFSTEDWVIQAIEKALEGKVKKAEVEMNMVRIGRRVLVDLRFSFSGTCVCIRCAQPIDIVFEGSEDLAYDPVGETCWDSELELDMEELDIGWYEDGKLDLSIVLCEAVVLCLPEHLYCELDLVPSKPKENCYRSPEVEERTLENMFANILKKQ